MVMQVDADWLDGLQAVLSNPSIAGVAAAAVLLAVLPTRRKPNVGPEASGRPGRSPRAGAQATWSAAQVAGHLVTFARGLELGHPGVAQALLRDRATGMKWQPGGGLIGLGTSPAA